MYFYDNSKIVIYYIVKLLCNIIYIYKTNKLLKINQHSKRTIFNKLLFLNFSNLHLFYLHYKIILINIHQDTKYIKYLLFVLYALVLSRAFFHCRRKVCRRERRAWLDKKIEAHYCSFRDTRRENAGVSRYLNVAFFTPRP